MATATTDTKQAAEKRPLMVAKAFKFHEDQWPRLLAFKRKLEEECEQVVSMNEAVRQLVDTHPDTRRATTQH